MRKAGSGRPGLLCELRTVYFTPIMNTPNLLLWYRQPAVNDWNRALPLGSGRLGAMVFGNVGLDWSRKNEDGRVRKYNALFVAENGTFIGPHRGKYKFIIKTLSPNYREFDESRYFYDLRKLALELGTRTEKLIAPVKACGLNLGCVICEDAWDGDYSLSPLQILTGQPTARFFLSILQ